MLIASGFVPSGGGVSAWWAGTYGLACLVDTYSRILVLALLFPHVFGIASLLWFCFGSQDARAGQGLRAVWLVVSTLCMCWFCFKFAAYEFPYRMALQGHDGWGYDAANIGEYYEEGHFLIEYVLAVPGAVFLMLANFEGADWLMGY